MKKTLYYCLLCLPLLARGQWLTPDRVAYIKACTVKINTEGDPRPSAGFFVRADGLILTTWHSIAPAIVRDPKTNAITSLKKIKVTTADGKQAEVGILLDLLNKDYFGAISYDYCLLIWANPNHPAVPYLKLGTFNQVSEGQEVFTCGYINGTDQPVVTRGIVSTKFVDSTIIIQAGKPTIIPRQQALLDMAMNRSGGAIVQPGTTIADDVVIGIADMLVVPDGQSIEAGMSSPIGGCIAINHLLDGIKRMNGQAQK
jgi:hypothetical protein